MRYFAATLRSLEIQDTPLKVFTSLRYTLLIVVVVLDEFPGFLVSVSKNSANTGKNCKKKKAPHTHKCLKCHVAICGVPPNVLICAAVSDFSLHFLSHLYICIFSSPLHFIMKKFKHTTHLKSFYSECLNTHHLDSAITILLYLKNPHISIHVSVLFLMHFKEIEDTGTLPSTYSSMQIFI